ncbi:MAG: hypothetical protein IT305_03380 [Chloroflexi bacterium]|nr:hypothetical protein [Chloroflexota bacterium]
MADRSPRRQTHHVLTHASEALFDSITAAFTAGDNHTGEALVQAALDSGSPWDAVTQAAARGVSQRFERRVTERREVSA